MVAWDWTTYFLFGGALLFAFVFLRRYDYQKEGNNVVLLIFALFPCFCLFAFRHEDVGIDLVRYAYRVYQAKYGAEFFFQKLLSGTLLSEPLSESIAYVSYYLGGIHAYIFLTTLIQYFFIVIFLIKLHNKGLNVTILFLLFFSVIQIRSCSMVRNGLAISSSFCAYICLLNEIKKQKWFWFFTVFAIFFHNSALINIPIYFICRPIEGSYWDIRKNIFLKIVSLISVIGIILLLQTYSLKNLAQTIADGKYAHYDITNTWGLGNLIVRLPLLFFFFIHLKKLKEEYGKKVASFFYLMIFDVVISQAKYIYNDLERISLYSVFGEIFFVSYFYDFIKKRVSFPFQFVYIVIVIGYFTYYMYRWAILGAYGLMPYKLMEW